MIYIYSSMVRLNRVFLRIMPSPVRKSSVRVCYRPLSSLKDRDTLYNYKLITSFGVQYILISINKEAFRIFSDTHPPPPSGFEKGGKKG